MEKRLDLNEVAVETPEKEAAILLDVIKNINRRLQIPEWQIPEEGGYYVEVPQWIAIENVRGCYSYAALVPDIRALYEAKGWRTTIWVDENPEMNEGTMITFHRNYSEETRRKLEAAVLAPTEN